MDNFMERKFLTIEKLQKFIDKIEVPKKDGKKN